MVVDIATIPRILPLLLMITQAHWDYKVNGDNKVS